MHGAQVSLELPESALFTAAVNIERHLDAALATHRSDIAALAGGLRQPKKLRIILQSRHFNQASAGREGAGVR
jgi:hypothetical protein